MKHRFPLKSVVWRRGAIASYEIIAQVERHLNDKGDTELSVIKITNNGKQVFLATRKIARLRILENVNENWELRYPKLSTIQQSKNLKTKKPKPICKSRR